MSARARRAAFRSERNLGQPHLLRRLPGHRDAAGDVRLVHHAAHRPGCATLAQHERLHGADHLRAVQAICDAEVMREDRVILEKQGKVEHGDAIARKCLAVLRQAEAVLDPLLDGRALRTLARVGASMHAARQTGKAGT